MGTNHYVLARAPVLVPVLDASLHPASRPDLPGYPVQARSAQAGPSSSADPYLTVAGPGHGDQPGWTVAAAAHGYPAAELASLATGIEAHIASAHQGYIRRSAEMHAMFLQLRGALRLPQDAAPAQLALAPPTVAAHLTAPGPVDAPTSPRKAQESLPGPRLDRRQLEIHGSGKVSSVFGPMFEGQDGHRHQLRIAKPPLLLIDRVLGIDGEPGSLGKGRIWSELTVPADAWYLDDQGRMPLSVMAEAGQANIVLMSYMGADLQHAGDRSFRFVGCDFKLHGPGPKVGERLVYEISVDGYSKVGDTSLFFLIVEGRVGDEVRVTGKMQSGLFTDGDLSGAGALSWDAATDKRALQGPFDPPARPSTRRAFTPAEVAAFRAGRPSRCFGPGFERADAHVRTPRLSGDRMHMLDEVTAFDPTGGPWKRGYLRTKKAVDPHAWFFAAHFHEDPCMPGFLAIDGAFQAVAFHMAALGFVIERDGCVFEVSVGQEVALRWRGQVTPQSAELAFEVFVESVRGGPEPEVVADVVMSIDGRPAFHMRRGHLCVKQAFPLDVWRESGPPVQQPTGAPIALSKLGGLVGHREAPSTLRKGAFEYGYAAMLAMSWGRATDAFGPEYRAVDSRRRMPRLPGPPFLFMSRVTSIKGATQGGTKPGGVLETAYDVPSVAWYFVEHVARVMPFAILLEVMLQPCGWLSSYVGMSPDGQSDCERLYRNLDGTLTWFAEVLPGTGELRTEVRLTAAPVIASMVLYKFEVAMWAGEQLIARVQSDFGLFPLEALKQQAGLPTTDADRANLTAPNDFHIDLMARPPRYFAEPLHLPGPMLLMIQRVTGYWPGGGRAGLGRLRAEKTIDPGEWFFKAHFYQDPVQPGSLGLEGLCQLLQLYMIERRMGEAVPNARFQSLMLERPVTWKYRGQVTPENRLVTSELEITEVGTDASGPFAVAEGWLWVDGLRVYNVKHLGIRIVSGAAPLVER